MVETRELAKPPVTRHFRGEQQRALNDARREGEGKPGVPWRYLPQAILSTLVQVEEGLYIAEPGELFDGWDRLARWGSTIRGGFFHTRADGCTWSSGSKSWVVMSTAGYDQLCQSRKILDYYRPDRSSGKAIKTLQQTCRELLTRCADMSMGSRQVQLMGEDHRHLIDNDRWCYMRIKPGTYRDCIMFDAAGYYWEIARRIPTPEVVVPPGQSPMFGPNKIDTAKRWRELLNLIGAYKGLRNTLIGCMSAGTRKKTAWYRGTEVERPTVFNWYTPCGFLIVRIGWELTQRAALEVDSIFSVGDCVVCQNRSRDNYPQSWREVGLPVTVKAEGDAEIFSMVSYRVGNHETKPYLAGVRRGTGSLLNDVPPPYQYADDIFV